MEINYASFLCVHALDESTEFLSSFRGIVGGEYKIMLPNEGSIATAIEAIKSAAEPALVIFLGHGNSAGLCSPQSASFPQKIAINTDLGNSIFEGKDVILLSCRSAEFITRLKGYKSIMGFGNIISSSSEIQVEADFTGKFRDLSDDDLKYFNSVYVDAILRSLNSILSGKLEFKDLPTLISYHINKEINIILRNKGKVNRVELARLLFEFRNEMCLISE